MSLFFELNQYPISSFKTEARKMVALAIPMMLAQIAAVAVGVVDTMMAGEAGKEDLTAVALGSSVFATLFITLMGVMTALNPMIAQLHGSGKTEEVGEIGRQGLWFGLILGILGAIFLVGLIAPLKNYLQFAEHTENMFGDYLFYAALALPAAMLHRALHAYASSLNRPRPIMWVSWAALFLNIPLNYIFIYGKLGMPEMGGAGCGVATALVFWFNFFALGIYIAKEKYFQPFGLTKQFSPPKLQSLKQIWFLGWAIGLSYFLEASLFTFIVWLIADLGENYVSAQQVVLSLSSVVYMIPQAIGSAATVRIGYSLGKRQFVRARYLSGVALLLGLVSGFFTLLILITFREFLVGLYTKDVGVIEIAASIAIFSAVFQLFDFTQCIASYALRGYKITRIPMIIHALAFWVVGLGQGYVLAYVFNMGIYGFWTALVVSLAAAAVALVWYLDKCSRWVVKHRGV